MNLARNAWVAFSEFPEILRNVSPSVGTMYALKASIPHEIKGYPPDVYLVQEQTPLLTRGEPFFTKTSRWCHRIRSWLPLKSSPSGMSVKKEYRS